MCVIFDQFCQHLLIYYNGILTFVQPSALSSEQGARRLRYRSGWYRSDVYKRGSRFVMSCRGDSTIAHGNHGGEPRCSNSCYGLIQDGGRFAGDRTGSASAQTSAQTIGISV